MSKIYLLNNIPFEGVENLEVFKIEFISSNINLKNYDALIFTSKNAIYSLDSFNKEWKNIDSYAIAPKTAKVIDEYNGRVKFIGKSSHGNEFAKELIPLLKDKRCLYIRAKKVVSNLVDILKKNNICIDELITYKTVSNIDSLDKEIENNSTIVFTSPSSVNCFFKKYQWNDTLRAIVIGKTTAKYLPENIKYEISSSTSIEECIKLAKKPIV
ncbi:uroporphyrinogen-III synthase [Arcobacter sp. LA11]|uniref:uroporphyrinogen-III synthase n=1 Tax=Arcobacter sp. LA11 TaxID=1898176 RepID=UPI000932BC97|nr:uroporphyrinogen-III synthase [Arcobacter sp. LA11]